jgi:uroporphyrinogen decarboxylase
VLPQYRRIIRLAHQAGKPLLWHSCGNIFPVMDAVIETGIDAKHSNEDQIAPFSRWIDDYSSRIGLFGGIDVNILCLKKPQEVFDYVVEHGTRYRKMAKGYALGSGNSVPDYVPPDGFLAMVEAAKKIRSDDLGKPA